MVELQAFVSSRPDSCNALYRTVASLVSKCDVHCRSNVLAARFLAATR